jgi:molybdenum cofactor cytidylyltransferase
LFDKHYFPELMSLSGDQGAKRVIQAHPNEVFEVEVLDPGVIRDIDTPDDLAS